MADNAPPPTYSQEDPDNGQQTSSSNAAAEPQMLILPTVDALNFQKGCLGVDGERAAIEGEIQIKGASSEEWDKLTVSLRTLEIAFDKEIELGFSETVLFSAATGGVNIPPSALFAIPLPQDTPQTIHTLHSSLSHTLTATLHPLDRSRSSLVKTHAVHTRRYTSHSQTLANCPLTRSISAPANVNLQISRDTFTAGEPIPVYVTIPPPPKTLVERGLRLRNVRAELVRVVTVMRDDSDEGTSTVMAEAQDDYEGPVSPGPASSNSTEKSTHASSSKTPISAVSGTSFSTVLSRSGAQCRFHSHRPVKLRFILRQSSPTASPLDFTNNLPHSDTTRHSSSDADCPSITQVTVLHAVTFSLHVNISFVDMSTRTERVSNVQFPIEILAPPAPLPEISASFDAAYQKKHDRPPVKTNRFDEGDSSSAPHYTAGEAGPSGLPPSGAPPPFTERDAPPPFFPTAGASSSGLPTFLESEENIIIPSQDAHPQMQTSPPTIAGEGVEFGFSAFDQFDGHSGEMQRSSTPPPTLEQANMDTNVTSLAEMPEPARSIEALGIVLDQEEAARGIPPPPPPALDDPSDPPPSIDSGNFMVQSSPHPSPPLRPVYSETEPVTLQQPPSATSDVQRTADRHAPPPYLVPGSDHTDQEAVIRPPPYVD